MSEFVINFSQNMSSQKQLFVKNILHEKALVIVYVKLLTTLIDLQTY